MNKEIAKIPRPRNKKDGFWSAMRWAAEGAWPVALVEIAKATDQPLESVGAFLDSLEGDTFADTVMHAMKEHRFEDPIKAAIRKWMGYPRRDNRILYEVSGSVPRLTGMVMYYGKKRAIKEKERSNV